MKTFLIAVLALSVVACGSPSIVDHNTSRGTGETVTESDAGVVAPVEQPALEDGGTADSGPEATPDGSTPPLPVEPPPPPVDPGPTCVKQTCEQAATYWGAQSYLERTCGRIYDGCGGFMNCPSTCEYGACQYQLAPAGAPPGPQFCSCGRMGAVDDSYCKDPARPHAVGCNVNGVTPVGCVSLGPQYGSLYNCCP